ncbi:MAG: dicarboxylate/amino acid:cation symporter [Eubacteriales bacterium]|nr:dicarboxylate/amino acid:cation symporter [Eubacteriales bacterium]
MNKLLKNSTFQIFLAMILGIIAGLIIPNVMVSVKFIGDIFLRLIQMTVVVLVMGSVIEAVGSLKRKEIGALGGKAFIGFACTTLIAGTVGIIGANIVRPGSGINFTGELTTEITGSDQTLAEIVTNFFPSNIVASIADGNTIQVIVFALLAGLAVSLLSETDGNNKILEGVKAINQVLLTVIKLVMKIAPLGIFSLLGWAIGNYGLAVILPLAKFLATFAVCAIVILAVFITLTSAYVKVSPLRLAKKLTNMGVVAFTTTSSAVTLPTKMADSENKIGISKRVSRLINPLGMSLNSDGLALYLALACLTVAQFFGVEMSIQQQFVVVIMSTLATLGTVVVPGGGLVALAIVLPTIGLPIEGVALLSGIDWFSGMFRTTLNVIDDVLVALIVAKQEGEFDREIFDRD